MIKKNNWFLKIFLTIFIIGLYFFSRLQHLTAIPVFGDEAIYIRWSQIIKSVETLRFIPQTDGKQPLFMWFTAVVFKFISDPLVASRFISILAGFLSLVGIFSIVCILISFSNIEKNPLKFVFKSLKDNFYFGFLSSIIYIFLPFSFFFDRMALPDNLLSMFGIWSLLFTLLLSKFKRLDLSLILGIVLGLAWLTKSPAIYFVVLAVFSFIVLNLKNLKNIYLPIISSVIAFIIYNILRLGPQFQMIALRNQDYIWSIGEILKHPFDPLKPHLGDALVIFNQYISWPVLIFVIIGLVIYFKKFKFQTKNFVVLCWFVLPFISNCIFAKVFTARYILFTLPPLIVLTTLGLSVFFKKTIFKIIFISLLFIPNLIFIFNLSTKPFEVKLPNTESGYLEGWTSGWGIQETAQYLQERSKQANVIVGTEGNFGTLPDGFQIYTNQVNQLTVIGLGLGFTKIPSNLTNAFKYGDEVYILINKSRLTIDSLDLDKLKLVKYYSKPTNDQLLLYQLQ